MLSLTHEYTIGRFLWSCCFSRSTRTHKSTSQSRRSFFSRGTQDLKTAFNILESIAQWIIALRTSYLPYGIKILPKDERDYQPCCLWRQVFCFSRPTRLSLMVSWYEIRHYSNIGLRSSKSRSTPFSERSHRCTGGEVYKKWFLLIREVLSSARGHRYIGC